MNNLQSKMLKLSNDKAIVDSIDKISMKVFGKSLDKIKKESSLFFEIDLDPIFEIIGEKGIKPIKIDTFTMD